MNKTQSFGTLGAARGGGLGGWQRWAPYAAVIWSLLYGVMGVYWAMGVGGFPYSPEAMAGNMGSVVGRLGPAAAWTIVLLAGIPAAAMGAAMLRGVRGRALRPL